MSDLHSIKILSKHENKVQMQVTIMHPDEHCMIAETNFALQLILIFYEDIVNNHIYNSDWQYYPFTQAEGNTFISSEHKPVLNELLLKMRWQKISVSKEEYENRQKNNDWVYQGEKVISMDLVNGVYSLYLETEYDSFCELADQYIEQVELLEVQHFPHWFDRVETHLAYEKTNYLFDEEVYNIHQNEPYPKYVLQITVKPEHTFLLHHLQTGSKRGSAQYDFLLYTTSYRSNKEPVLHTLMYSSKIIPPSDDVLIKWWNDLEIEWQVAFLMNLYVQQHLLFPEIEKCFGEVIFKSTFEQHFSKEFLAKLNLFEMKPQLFELRLISQLKIMYATGFNFKNLEPLRMLKDLKLLNVERNAMLENIEALGDITTLNELKLYVENNKADLTCIKKLNKLCKLYMQVNKLEELEAIYNMPDLRSLTLHAHFEFNSDIFLEIAKLKNITVYSNYTYNEQTIFKLREKGVHVLWIKD